MAAYSIRTPSRVEELKEGQPGKKVLQLRWPGTNLFELAYTLGIAVWTVIRSFIHFQTALIKGTILTRCSQHNREGS